MLAKIARTGLLFSALAVAGCTESLEDIAPKSEKALPAKLVTAMEAKGMTQTSPIMVRIFKEEALLEVWKQKDNGRYDLISSYDICKWSGKLGPKFTEGDRQAPEGFYTVRPGQMNPKSSYHLAFNIGFPNAYDRALGRTGAHLMVHGACSSAGCYSMSDESVEEIYAFARDAFRGGQEAFQIQAFPFRMTPENMARYKDDPNYKFWTMLKEGYDHFEITKVPPKVDVCEKRYVFNLMPEEGQEFSATGACPAATQSDSLRMAYSSFQTSYEAAFSAALGGGSRPAPKPSIAGIQEASLVADWSRKRQRGERVSREPPSLTAVAEPAAGTAIQSASAASEAEVSPAAVASALPASAPTPQAKPGDVQIATGSTAADQLSRMKAQPAAPEPASLRKRLWGLFGR
jgi:murein L,D-transpeptidase YafK